MQKWPKRSRDCLYYMSIDYYRLKEFKLAKDTILKVLRIEPNNKQAADLLNRIDKKVNQGNFSIFKFSNPFQMELSVCLS